jgi:dipeptidyl aminopeptidase/acylaminoacyl peptidase
VWWYPVAEDEVAHYGELPGDARGLAWIDPDRLVVLVDVSGPAASGDPITISWLRYKSDGRRSFLEPPNQLWVLDTRDGSSRLALDPAGPIRAFCATGAAVVYAMSEEKSDAVEEHHQVRVIDVDDGGDRLVWDCPAAVDAVAGPLPLIVAISTGRDTGPALRRLWHLTEGRAAAQVFPDLDASFEYAVQGDTRLKGTATRVSVTPNGDIYAVATMGGDAVLVRGSITDATPGRLTPSEASVTDFTVTDTGAVAVCLERPDAPVELHLIERPGRDLRRVSDLNTDWVAAVHPIGSEPIEVDSHDGIRLPGLLYRPSGAGPHPLVVRVHGGPHLCSGNAFSLETQILLSAGYAVLLPNVRGSDGWGETFRSLSVGEWGGRDYEDLMVFVDHATARPDIDEACVYLAGGSYGGYLTNWALTQTNRFRAAISERSVSNLISKYGTADNGFSTNRSEMGGADLFDDGIELLVERSPLRHAPSVTTPVLLLHGEDDYRCPIEQSEQFFVALRRLGKEAVLVRFPGESHDFSSHGRPDHRIARLEMILAWLADHG